MDVRINAKKIAQVVNAETAYVNSPSGEQSVKKPASPAPEAAGKKAPDASPRRPEPADAPAERHVFLSHNGQDIEQTLELGALLESHGLRTWLDKRDLLPGRWWQAEIEDAIRNARAAIVTFGPHGLGQWEKPEMRVCIDEAVRRKLPVVPTLLPGAPDPLRGLPPLLLNFSWA
ncbi:MAG: toll/interleukin-1 receptor domain-containing protein, partial [Acidobacteriota bacterium]